MKKKNFGGFPHNQNVVLAVEHPGMPIVSLHSRNEGAAKSFKSGVDPHEVLAFVAEHAITLSNQPGPDGRLSLATIGSEALAIQLERIEVRSDTLSKVLHVGLYGVPRNLSVEIDVSDFDRLSSWWANDPNHEGEILQGIVSLWISVSDPITELRRGRTAFIDQLDDGDHVALRFAGLDEGLAPFVLCIETEEDVARLKAKKEAA